MAYIRHKVIKGHVYYYLVEGRREGDRVRQKVLKYLGKNGSLNASSGVAFRGFTEHAESQDQQSSDARQRLKLKKAFKSLGFIVRHNLSGRTKTRGSVLIKKNRLTGEVISRSVSLLKTPSLGTMCHELGHAIDYNQRDKGQSFWRSRAFSDARATIQLEFENVGKLKYSDSLKGDPSLLNRPFFQDYVFTDNEGYANSFELFLTDYKTALSVVPNMVAHFHDMVRSDDEIRQLVESLDVWALSKPEPIENVVPN